MAAYLKIIDGTGTLRVIACTVTKFGPAIENHFRTSLNRCCEFNVDGSFEYLRYDAFPVTDIGFDGICVRNALVIEVATDTYQISDLKLGGTYTQDFCLGINSENPGEKFVFDSNGTGSTRNHPSYIDRVCSLQRRPNV